MEATSPLPEILVLETTLGLGGRPPLDAAFVAVCDTVLMAWKGERRSPLPTLLSGSASARQLRARPLRYQLAVFLRGREGHVSGPNPYNLAANHLASEAAKSPGPSGFKGPTQLCGVRKS